MRFRHKIEIQRRTKAQDTAGQVEEIWQTRAEVWADIQPVRTREFFTASGERAEVTHTVLTWYRDDVEPQDRILYNGRVFDITGVRNMDEQCRRLQLMCVETV